jgi:hypothetical protein
MPVIADAPPLWGSSRRSLPPERAHSRPCKRQSVFTSGQLLSIAGALPATGKVGVAVLG